MDLTIMNITGKETGKKVTLEESIFGIEPNDHAIYLDVKQHLANKRQGTHKAKERSEITGSTRKLKKQKGSGSARFGDIKNPLFRSGGRVFGPRPRDYSFKLNKKVKTLARISALSYKAKTNQLLVLEDFDFEAPKTKEFSNFQKNFNLDNKKSLSNPSYRLEADRIDQDNRRRSDPYFAPEASKEFRTTSPHHGIR